MPDINLLDDTKTPEAGTTKPRASHPGVEYTAPARIVSTEPEPRLPSSFWSRARGWFSPKVKKSIPAIGPAKETLKPVIKAVAPDSRVYTQPTVSAPVPTRVSPPAPTVQPMRGVGMSSLPQQKPRTRLEKSSDRAPVSDDFMVNLLPDDLAGKVNARQKLLLFGAVIGACVVVVGVIGFVLSLYKSNIVRRTEDVRAQRAGVEQAIRGSRNEQKESIAFEDRAQTMQALLNRHIYWTKFFAKLERYTDPEVAFNGSFSGDIKGTMTLQASAKDYRAMARQMLIFKEAKDFVTLSVTTSASVSQSADSNAHVVFGVQLTLVPDIFTETAQDFQALHGITQ